MATIKSSGRIKERSPLINSMIRATAEIGPCVVAPITAPAPSKANNPGGTPGQKDNQMNPKIAEQHAERRRARLYMSHATQSIDHLRPRELRSRSRRSLNDPQFGKAFLYYGVSLLLIMTGNGDAQHSCHSLTGSLRTSCGD